MKEWRGGGGVCRYRAGGDKEEPMWWESHKRENRVMKETKKKARSNKSEETQKQTQLRVWRSEPRPNMEHGQMHSHLPLTCIIEMTLAHSDTLPGCLMTLLPLPSLQQCWTHAPYNHNYTVSLRYHSRPHSREGKKELYNFRMSVCSPGPFTFSFITRWPSFLIKIILQFVILQHQ